MKKSNILSVEIINENVKVTYVSLREYNYNTNVDKLPQTVINYIIDNSDTVVSKVYEDGTTVNVYADTNTLDNALRMTKYYYIVMFGGVELTYMQILDYYVEYTAKYNYTLTMKYNKFYFGNEKNKYPIDNDSAFYRMIMHYSIKAHKI